jgi:preprotein translocase subunit SecE
LSFLPQAHNAQGNEIRKRVNEMADKQKKEKKENFFKRAANGIATYAKATKSELKKVSWPTPKQLVNNTAIVVVCIVVIGIFIFILDAIFGLGFKALNNNKAESGNDTSDDSYAEVSSEDLYGEDEDATYIYSDEATETTEEVTE